MNLLLVLPLLIPMLTASLCLFAWKRPVVQQCLSTGGAAALLLVAILLLNTVWHDGIQVVQAGNWKAPYGITLVADLFSAIMLLLAALMSLAVNIYSAGSIDARRVAYGYYPLLQVLLMGISGAFLTGDIFNLYVWFEVMLMASFVLLALGGERAQLEGAIKYVTLNLISSTLFLTAAGLLYATAGTLNMADLAVKLQGTSQPGLVTTLSMLLLVSFGIKAGVFPLFFWLPASYHTPPVAVSAIFAGLLTKVGVYSLVRVFSLIFVQDIAYTHTIILVIAALTMLTGVLGAIAQSEFRRVLAFLIISGIGFAITGLGLFTQLSLTGMVFYVINSVVVTTVLYLISGITLRLAGTEKLPELGGLYAARPGLALLFLLAGLSLAGIPPLSGFFAKLILLQAGVASGRYGVVAVLLIASILTLFVISRIWSEVFWKAAPAKEVSDSSPEVRGGAVPKLLLWPVAALASLTVLIGLGAEPVFMLSARAAQQLIEPNQYITAVLGAMP
jgi:multicomponent Na+:H+ antiporter subunit D